MLECVQLCMCVRVCTCACVLARVYLRVCTYACGSVRVVARVEVCKIYWSWLKSAESFQTQCWVVKNTKSLRDVAILLRKHSSLASHYARRGSLNDKAAATAAGITSSRVLKLPHKLPQPFVKYLQKFSLKLPSIVLCRKNTEESE